MSFDLDLFKPVGSIQKKNFDEIFALGEITRQHSIELTAEKVQYIVDSHQSALLDMERVEFGESAAKKITEKFCASPFVSKYNFEKTVGSLIEIFYYIQNETEDLLTDNELIDKMYEAFNGFCGGSVTLLNDWSSEFIKRAKLNTLNKPQKNKKSVNELQKEINLDSKEKDEFSLDFKTDGSGDFDEEAREEESDDEWN